MVRIVSSSAGEGPGGVISRGFTERRIFRSSRASGIEIPVFHSFAADICICEAIARRKLFKGTATLTSVWDWAIAKKAAIYGPGRIFDPDQRPTQEYFYSFHKFTFFGGVTYGGIEKD